MIKVSKNKVKNERLVNLRLKAGLTQGQLAEVIGTSQSMIARIESGEREPRKTIKLRLAKFFNVSVEWLFYEQLDDYKSCSDLAMEAR
ncbi:MAG: helix-turn-helix domain-containing protein [Armatimonadetes bacterium]|nr:helix-turn-helix domain-containing protein [Armatimonadota bacterium]